MSYVNNERWKSFSNRTLLRQLRRESKLRGKPPEVPPYERPKTRGDCRDGFRPCPFVGCAHHLFVEVKTNGSLRFPWGDDIKALKEMPSTCSLDVADTGAITLEETGHMMLITRERVRQIEGRALAKLKDSSDATFAKDEADVWEGEP